MPQPGSEGNSDGKAENCSKLCQIWGILNRDIGRPIDLLAILRKNVDRTIFHYIL